MQAWTRQKAVTAENGEPSVDEEYRGRSRTRGPAIISRPSKSIGRSRSLMVRDMNSTCTFYAMLGASSSHVRRRNAWRD